MESKKAELTRAVAEAENAVVAIKDPELRRAAFEKVLEHLLGAGSVPARKGKLQQRLEPAKKATRGPPGLPEFQIVVGDKADFTTTPGGLAPVS